jgi:hypothetical protein
MQVSPVTMSRPSLRAVAPPPCLLLHIKDSGGHGAFGWGKLLDGGVLVERKLLKGELLKGGLLKGGNELLAEGRGAEGKRIAEGELLKLKRTWDSASLGTKTKKDHAKEQLRENMAQSESKERDFKEQKRRLLEASF